MMGDRNLINTIERHMHIDINMLIEEHHKIRGCYLYKCERGLKLSVLLSIDIGG